MYIKGKWVAIFRETAAPSAYYILNNIPNAHSHILLNIKKKKKKKKKKRKKLVSLQILYMMKIAIFKQSAEILSQSVISVENNRTFGNPTLHSKNPNLLK